MKQNLANVGKALARARSVWRCRKFESIIDGTVDRCDFSDDTYSDESSDGEDDPDEDEEMTRVNTRTTMKMKRVHRRRGWRTIEEKREEKSIEWTPSNIRLVLFHFHYSFESRQRWIQKSLFARSVPLLTRNWKNSILILERFTLFIMRVKHLTRNRELHHGVNFTRKKHSTQL